MHYKNIHTQQIINWNDMEFGTIEKSFCGICNKEEDGTEIKICGSYTITENEIEEK